VARTGDGEWRAWDGVDLTVRVGDLPLRAPVLTAAGTSGHGAELHGIIDLSLLGAVVVKSLAPYPWAGNPAPRLHPATAAMLNSVGLQGPGLARWLADDLPGLQRAGAAVVCSIWGTTVEEYAQAAALLADAPPSVVAVEVNLSCPNLKGKGMFAQSVDATREVMAATATAGRPRWAKLTAAVTDLPSVAAAAQEGGAAAVTLVNTLPGLALDLETRRPVLGAGSGGLSGAAIHPVAVKAVWDVHAALPDLPVVGVGGVTTGADAVELLLAGAAAVQVGTATFADPRAPERVLLELAAWCRDHGVARVADLTAAAHPAAAHPAPTPAPSAPSQAKSSSPGAS
jgi:dihydroorotate dehydrogenase (NAD+) catalytic subunit